MNWDFSIVKNFKIREGQRLEFRAESFNLFNTPLIAQPAAAISAPASFGQTFSTISRASGFLSQRQIQFALKYIF